MVCRKEEELGKRRERMFYESNESMSHESMSQQVGSAVFHMVSTKCRLQTGYKMQTEFKMQTDKKNCFFASEAR